MGTAVVFGMSVATLLGVFIIPACYSFVQGLAGRGDGAKPSPETPADAHAQGGGHS
jgi:hypothetical protein